MVKAFLAKLWRWRAVVRAQVALVLVLTLMMAGLPGHITSVHAAAPDTQSLSADDGHAHSDDETEGPVQHGGHSLDQDAADHTHQHSLLTNEDALRLRKFPAKWEWGPQDSFRGSARFSIDKPPKQAVSA